MESITPKKIMYSSNEKLNIIYSALFASFERISNILRNSPGGGHHLESFNAFGDHQLDTDIDCEEAMILELKKTGLIKYVLTEENPAPNDIGGKDYIICFDPLDGSSIIGTNFSIGSVFAVWPYDENILIGKTGRDIVAAGVALYGSRTSVLIDSDGKTEEYSLVKSKANGEFEWAKSMENIKIEENTKFFAPGNLRAVNENAEYKELVDYWISKNFTLRYTGGLVPDVYQIFVRGNGIFTNLPSKSNPEKLRLLYEVFPIAKLVESAGGRTSNGEKCLMDTIISSYDQRSSICVGSAEEVDRIEKTIKKIIKK